MLKPTQTVDYAVRSMIFIASMADNTSVLRCELARHESIPPSFVAKILTRLVRAGLLRSSRGARGGFRLARPASQITLLDVIEAIEGRFVLRARSRLGSPATRRVWDQVQDELCQVLRRTTLEELVSRPARDTRHVVGMRPPASHFAMPHQ